MVVHHLLLRPWSPNLIETKPPETKPSGLLVCQFAFGFAEAAAVAVKEVMLLSLSDLSDVEKEDSDPNL